VPSWWRASALAALGAQRARRPRSPRLHTALAARARRAYTPRSPPALAARARRFPLSLKLKPALGQKKANPGILV